MAIRDTTVQSIDRALSLLETLAQYPRGMGVTELGKAVGLPKSTVYRLLTALAARGFVEQDRDSDRYRPGLKLMELGLTILRELDLRREALPFLEDLVQVSREMAQLAVLDDGEVLVVERLVYPEVVTLNLGLRLPAHCTAAGKVLLAAQPGEQVSRIVNQNGLPRLTANTITDLEYLLAHLEKVRAQGYAISADEQAEGVREVAAPVFDHLGRVVAALSIAGPSQRLTLERIGRLLGVVKETSLAISHRLGYREKER